MEFMYTADAQDDNVLVRHREQTHDSSANVVYPVICRVVTAYEVAFDSMWSGMHTASCQFAVKTHSANPLKLVGSRHAAI